MKIRKIQLGTNESTKEVIAINVSNDAIVGYLNYQGIGKKGPVINCENEHEILKEITYYVEIEEFIEYIKKNYNN